MQPTLSENCNVQFPIQERETPDSSTPDRSSPAKKLRKTRADLKHAHQQQLTELGFDVDSQYVKGLAHFNQANHRNVTQRRSSNGKTS